MNTSAKGVPLEASGGSQLSIDFAAAILIGTYYDLPRSVAIPFSADITSVCDKFQI